MSIRLRLTLIYTAILALTLIVFSASLYFTQDRLTMRLARDRLLAGPQSSQGARSGRLPAEHGPPRPFRDGVFRQVRDFDGDIIEPDASLGQALPLSLSERGLRAVRQGRSWVEVATIDQERFLVLNQPVTAANGERYIAQTASSLANQDRFLAGLRTLLLIGSAIAVLVAFGAGWLLAGLTLRPINRIRQTAQAIGVEQNFNRRVDYSGPKDEVGQLASTFNDMLTQLQAAYRQVEQSLKVQQNFVADASHELRTPLTTLRGNIDLLRRQPPLAADEQADILADMESESERLIRLVNDLLVLARADAKRPLRREPVHLKPLIDDVCQQINSLAAERVLTCQTPAGAQLVGDRDALKQVLLILLDNALRHTPPHTTITVATQVTNHEVIISVQDNGPGIDPVRLPHIFDRFYRGDSARSGGGTGLGLSIARELVQAMHGIITVESQIGEGTVFKLTFPKSS